MAVDSSAKRLSMIGFGNPGYPAVVIPDGDIEAEDRADLLGLYAGLELVNPATVLGTNLLRNARTLHMLSLGQVHYRLRNGRAIYLLKRRKR